MHPLSSEDAACVARVCAAQRFGVLATYGAGQPYASLVAVAASAALEAFVFATLRSTRKFANLTACPQRRCCWTAAHISQMMCVWRKR